MKDCDVVAERLALGEPLGDRTAHAASCSACAQLAQLPAQLRAGRPAIDPGLGFAARITAGAQHRIAARRRRRAIVGVASSVAAGALGVLVVARDPAVVPTRPEPVSAVVAPRPEPWGADDVAALVDLADTGRTRRLTADWAQIERPLAPYQRLVRGAMEEAAVEPGDDGLEGAAKDAIERGIHGVIQRALESAGGAVDDSSEGEQP
jgi:hypothetical protein